MVAPAIARGPIETAVAGYYGRAFAAHGAAHRGVDWSSAESQALRFGILLDGVDWTGRPSLLDYGCGYGALAGHLDRIGADCGYVGHDIVAPMIEAARQANRGRPDRSFTTVEPASDAGVPGARAFDHVVASGIFNVRLDTPPAIWEEYVWEMIGRLGSLAGRRLAFNMLPPVSCPELARPHLHHADPAVVAERCAGLFGGRVSVREDYGLWEFTIVVEFGRPATA